MKFNLSFQFLFVFLMGMVFLSCQKKDEVQKKDPVSPEVKWNSTEGCYNYANQIVGGKILEKSDLRSRSVFQIHTIGKNADDQSERILCTATLVRKNILLTAAHCLDLKKIESIIVFFNTSYMCNEGMNKSLLYSAKKYIVHEKYKLQQEPAKNAFNYDLALVRLSTDAPTFTLPMDLWNGQLSTYQSTSKAYLVGYGKTSTRASSKEIPRLRLAERNMSDIRKIESQGKVEVAQSSVNGACQGDSGGPLLVQQGSRFVVAGVASYLEGEWWHRNRLCEQSIILYNDTSIYRNWINLSIKKLQ